MTLAVIGTSSAAFATAALAAVASGEPILLQGTPPDGRPGIGRVRWAGQSQRVVTAYATADVPADLYVIVAEADTHAALLDERRSQLSGKGVLLAPGGVAGGPAAAAAVGDMTDPPWVAETNGFPAVGTVEGDTVRLRAIKRRLPVAGSVGGGFGAVELRAFRRYFPDLELVDPPIPSLANTNHVIHPPLVVANAAQVAAGTPFRLYQEGLTETGIRLVEAVDRERLAITDRLGLGHVPLTEWLARFYGDQGMTGTTIEAQLRGFAAFADTPGPTSAAHRYLLEDVTFGLAPLEVLGAALDVATPAISQVVGAACALTSRNLHGHAEERAALILSQVGRAWPVPASPATLAPF